jgi:hypothetical protein
MGSLKLAESFLPMSIFSNTDIVEYNKGKYTYVTGSKSQLSYLKNISSSSLPTSNSFKPRNHILNNDNDQSSIILSDIFSKHMNNLKNNN